MKDEASEKMELRMGDIVTFCKRKGRVLKIKQDKVLVRFNIKLDNGELLELWVKKQAVRIKDFN